MSTTGRLQDALYNLYEHEAGWGRMEDGPVKKAGITYEQWSSLIDEIVETALRVTACRAVHFETGMRVVNGEVYTWWPASPWPRQKATA